MYIYRTPTRRCAIYRNPNPASRSDFLKNYLAFNGCLMALNVFMTDLLLSAQLNSLTMSQCCCVARMVLGSEKKNLERMDAKSALGMVANLNG